MKFNFLSNFLQNSIDSNKISVVHNFINELKENLNKKQSFECAKKLPWHTTLNFAKFENNLAICFDSINKKIYYIPKENILGTKPEPGEVLKINSPGKFYVDYTGIPIKENLIDETLNKCEIAN